MSDRDTLTDLIDDTRADGHSPREAAAYLLAAGWRPPAREITTLDELLDVPVGTVVRSSAGTIACRFDLRRGVVFGDDRPFEWARLALPATVVPVPTDDPDCPHDSRSGADGRWRCDQCGADCGPDTYLTPTEEACDDQ